MIAENNLDGTASLFLALGDKTRLRLLNLMRDREICVSSFTGVLGHSQPLISRHLAYLRNTGLVEARRDGKWMHYSVASGLDDNSSRLLAELFKWMELQEGLRSDRTRYFALSGEIEPQPRQPRRVSTAPKPRATRARVKVAEPVVTEDLVEQVSYEPRWQNDEREPEEYQPVRHNELEDFLL